MSNLHIRKGKVKATRPNRDAKWRNLAAWLAASGQDEKWSARQGQLVRLAEAAGDRRRVNHLLERHETVNRFLRKPYWGNGSSRGVT